MKLLWAKESSIHLEVQPVRVEMDIKQSLTSSRSKLLELSNPIPQILDPKTLPTRETQADVNTKILLSEVEQRVEHLWNLRNNPAQILPVKELYEMLQNYIEDAKIYSGP